MLYLNLEKSSCFYLIQFGDLLESRDEFMLYLNLEKRSCYT